MIIDTMMDLMTDKINRIYIPRSGITIENANNVISIYDGIKAMPMLTQSDLEAVIASLKVFSPTSYASGATRDRILEDRNYLIKVLDLQLSRLILDQTIDISVNPDPDTIEEIVLLQAPLDFRIENDSLKWSSVDHAFNYEIVATKDGIDQTVNVNGTSYSLINFPPGEYTFKIRSIGDGFFYESSTFSPSVSHTIEAIILVTPQNLRVENKIVLFDAVSGALSYRLMIDFSDFELTTTSFSLSQFNLGPGTYQITIQAIGNGNAIIDSSVSPVYYYVIEKSWTAEELLVQEIIKSEIKEFVFSWLTRKGE